MITEKIYPIYMAPLFTIKMEINLQGKKMKDIWELMHPAVNTNLSPIP
jgi:hypothetical protein